MHCRKDSY